MSSFRKFRPSSGPKCKHELRCLHLHPKYSSLSQHEFTSFNGDGSSSGLMPRWCSHTGLMHWAYILIKCWETKPAKHAHARSNSITTEADPSINHKGVRNHKNEHISVNTCTRTAHPPLSVFDLCKAAIYLLLEWTCKHKKHNQPPRNQWHFTSFSSLWSCSSWPVWPVNSVAVSKGGGQHRCECCSSDAFTRSFCLTNSV